MKQPLIAEVRGRDSTSGSHKTIEVTSNDVVEAIDEVLRLVGVALSEVVEETPRALAADIYERGVVLSGGGARLRGLDLYIATQTGIPAKVADQPETSVVRGTGLAWRGRVRESVSTRPRSFTAWPSRGPTAASLCSALPADSPTCPRQATAFCHRRGSLDGTSSGPRRSGG
jgi:hypothetical protein